MSTIDLVEFEIRTAEQIRKEVAHRSWQGRQRLRRMQNVTDMHLYTRYKRGAGRIANSILMHGDETGKLTRLMRDIEAQMAQLSRDVTRTLERTVGDAFDASLRSTVFQAQVFKGMLPGQYRTALTPISFGRLHHRAVKALLTGPDGIELSDRVWNMQRATLDRMKRFVVNSYLRGDSSNKIAAGAKRFLISPDVDMRTTKWRTFFQENPPGRGVYRSAQKNVQRMLRTEVNGAYRMATAEYAQERSWVQGVKWYLVPAHHCCDECDDIAETDMFGLGEGVYPADSVPITPHPQCLCYTGLIAKPELMPGWSP